MTVGELIEALEKMDHGAIVIMQEDSEGNGFSPLSEVEAGYYDAQTTWSGEVYDTDEPTLEDQPCVVLSPVN